MRVTEMDNQLVLRTPWRAVLSPLAGGLFLLAVSVGFFWMMARESQLTCRRVEADQIQCQIQQVVLGRVVKQVTVDDPERAVVQSQRSSKGGTSYRVALISARGTFPLTDFYAGDVDADGLAGYFNAFRANPAQKTLTLNQPIGPWTGLGVLLFFVFALVMILTTHYDTVVFDRYRDTVTYTRLGFTGLRTREESIGGLRTEVRQFRGSKGRRYYCVFLRLAGSAPDIKLDWNASSEAAAQDLADRVQEFVKPGVHIKYARA